MALIDLSYVTAVETEIERKICFIFKNIFIVCLTFFNKYSLIYLVVVSSHIVEQHKRQDLGKF